MKKQKIADMVKWRADIGYGTNWSMLQSLIQEILLAVTSSNPDRKTGWEDRDQLPERTWVRRFAERHNLALRSTSEISKGRQVVSPDDLARWQQDTIHFFSSKF